MDPALKTNSGEHADPRTLDQRVRHRPRIALILWTASALLALGVGPWLGLARISVNLREETGFALATVLETTHQAFRTWVRGEQTSALIWAESPEIVELARELLVTDPEPATLRVTPAQRRLRGLLTREQEARGYEGFFVIGPDHVNLSSSRDINVGTVNLLAGRTEAPGLGRPF